MRLSTLALLSTTLFACATGRAPAAGDSAEEHRQLRADVARLEQKLAELAERMEARSGGGEMTSQAATEPALEHKVERLAQRQAELEAELDRAARTGAGAAPTPSRPDRGRPDAAVVYAVPVAGYPSRGPKDAPVTLVRSFEFACPYSHKSRTTMDDLIKDYPNDLRIVYRNFVVHPQQATIPARAACAAGKQGRYLEMHDLIWTQGWEANRDLSMANMERLASDLKLDVKKLVNDMDGKCIDEITRDQAELTTLGQGGTPAFWINGRFLSGARPIEDFKALIDAELATAKGQIGKRGVTRGNYYKRVILKKGKKSI